MTKGKLAIEENLSLSSLTTIKLGGKARYFVSCKNEEDIIAALKYAKENSLDVFVISGGSNVVFPDSGYSGLILKVDNKGIDFQDEIVVCKAGEDWDNFVAQCVDKGLGYIECLSGIPGSVGSTPIQNVGAYGQEVKDSIVSLKAIDRETYEIIEFSNAECEFGYRSSRFKSADKDKYIITEVTFRLKKNCIPHIRYAELNRYLNHFLDMETLLPGREKLTIVRNAVLEIRRKKSMLIDPKDPNSVSCGSFFTNPILDEEEFRHFKKICKRMHIKFPMFDDPKGTKLSAAWLIENAGLEKGYQRRGVGISEKHTLALVNYGEGTTEALLSLANWIKEKVKRKFSVELEIEPVIVS
ncbi:MAG: UDP-N-acetylmuramate dehydrogenase [Ignavibacteriae bacterium]|nr:UDP-N-acetylmuramate dehydrogenase [Ignavibacteriota bacterium]